MWANYRLWLRSSRSWIFYGLKLYEINHNQMSFQLNWVECLKWLALMVIISDFNLLCRSNVEYFPALRFNFNNLLPESWPRGSRLFVDSSWPHTCPFLVFDRPSLTPHCTNASSCITQQQTHITHLIHTKSEVRAHHLGFLLPPDGLPAGLLTISSLRTSANTS